MEIKSASHACIDSRLILMGGVHHGAILSISCRGCQMDDHDLLKGDCVDKTR